MPIGAFIASQELMSVFKEDPFLGHITTFGGHPVCAAAALATLESILEEKLIENVAVKEQLFNYRLGGHPAIKAMRSHGLMMAIELNNYSEVKSVIDFCIKKGLISDWFLFASNCVRIAPPLIITLEEINKACDILILALETINK